VSNGIQTKKQHHELFNELKVHCGSSKMVKECVINFKSNLASKTSNENSDDSSIGSQEKKEKKDGKIEQL
jgi:hypothetical protein